MSSTLFSLVSPEDIANYLDNEEFLQISPFDGIFRLLSTWLETEPQDWIIFPVFQALEEGSGCVCARDFKQASHLCSSVPDVAFAVRKRLALFLPTIITEHLVTWYASVSKYVAVYAWLAEELRHEIIVRVRAITIHDTPNWFEPLAIRVLRENFLPELVPTIKIQCIRLLQATHEAAVHPQH